MAKKPYTPADRHAIALSALEDAIFGQWVNGDREKKPEVDDYITVPDDKREFTQWELYNAVYEALENTCPTY